MNYPQGDLDRPANLLAVLGSFWSSSYDGRALLRTYVEGLGRSHRQVERMLQEAADCLSYDRVPALHREEWSRIPIRESSRRGVPRARRFGGGRAFGDGLRYGFPLPDEAAPFQGVFPVEAPVLCNRLERPSRVLLPGLDFVLADQELTLRVDPFRDAAWTAREIVDADGLVVDREIDVWIFRPGYDLGYLSQHWGFLLGGDWAPATESARALLAASLAALAGGTSLAALTRMLEAVAGTSLAHHTGERVELVAPGRGGPVVVTDREVYHLPAGAVPRVQVGDRLIAGQALSDALEVFELNRGAPAGLPALALGPGLCDAARYGPLVFEDRAVPVRYTRDAGGRARVTFDLSGDPRDVAAFWALVREREGLSGWSVARALDLRGADAVTEPAAQDLPATVNPLAWVTTQALGQHALVVRMRPSPSGVGLGGLRLLRMAMPPQSTLIVVVSMPTMGGAAIMESLADARFLSDAATPLGGVLVPQASWGEATSPRVPESC